MAYAEFNRTNLVSLRKEMLELLAKYAPEGVEFTVGNMKFTSTDCKVDVVAKIKGADTFEDTMLKTRMESLKLSKKNALGMELTSYKSSNYKMPFIYKGVDGKSYKCTTEQAIRLFSNK